MEQNNGDTALGSEGVSPAYPVLAGSDLVLAVELCRCFAARQITEALLRKNYHDKLPHQIPAAAAAQDVLRRYYRKAKKRLAAENDQDAESAADAGAEDRDDEDDGEDAEDEHAAAAKGQAALNAASAAASDGITGNTSGQHMMSLLGMLPDAQRAAEDAAAAGGRGRQQDEKWAKRNQDLSKVLAHGISSRMLLQVNHSRRTQQMAVHGSSRRLGPVQTAATGPAQLHHPCLLLLLQRAHTVSRRRRRKKKSSRCSFHWMISCGCCIALMVAVGTSCLQLAACSRGTVPC